MKEQPRLKTRYEWSQEVDPGFTFTAPSMCEPVHNLSLEELIRDYTRGIVHTFGNTPMYDDGEDLPDAPLDDIEDFADILPVDPAIPTPDPSEDPEPSPAPMEDSSSE